MKKKVVFVYDSPGEQVLDNICQWCKNFQKSMLINFYHSISKSILIK